MKRAPTTKTTTAPASREYFSAAKERRLRQWAAKIVSDLPPDEADSRRVLSLAEQLRTEWLVDWRSVPKGGAA